MTNERIRIAKIKECIDHIEKYTARGKDYFLDDIKTQDAVLRNFQVMGQVIKDLPEKIKS